MQSQINGILLEILYSFHSPWKNIGNIEQSANQTQKILLGLLRGEAFDIRKIDNKGQILSAVIWKKDEKILKDARNLIQTAFSEIFLEVSSKNLSDAESFHMEIVIGELLALYPYLKPGSGDVLQVPVKSEGKWLFVNYEVEKIKLTKPWMGSPLVAYGLNVKNPDQKAPPILLFKGTNYPADDGFSLSLLTDLNPFYSIGSYAFHLGKEQVGSWLDKQLNRTGCKAVIHGKSLGGALAWRTALKFPEKVAKVMAYGSPGFNQKALGKLEKMKDGSRPEINFFCQKNDPVPFFDQEAHQGVNYYEIIGSRPLSGVSAHANIYATHKDSVVIKVKPCHMAKKWKRRGLSIFRHAMTLTFPFLLIAHLIQTGARKLAKIVRRRFKEKKGILPV